MREYVFKTNKEIKSCNGCELGSAIGFRKTQCLVDALVKDNDSPDCPLVELPEHGNLKDADKIYKRLVQDIKDLEKEDISEEEYQTMKAVYQSVLFELGEEPTVLEASK